MKKCIPFLILAYTLLIFKCSENPSKPAEPVLQIRDTITINIEQITHRSVSLRLTKKLKAKSDRYVLNRISAADTFAFAPFALQQKDTLIIDDNDGEGLALDSEYSYFAYRLDSLETAKDTSETITAKTLAATSHNFTWTEYTLGNGELRDVWGTDENNVYAVGGVETDSGYYSIIHWDGSEWRGIAPESGGSSIFGFSDSDIWVAGGGVSHFDGRRWLRISHKFNSGSVIVLDQVLYENTPYASIWGTSSADLYFVGNKGKVIYWDGTKARIELDTEGKNLIDIHGSSQNNIWTVGVDKELSDYVAYFNGSSWNEVKKIPYTHLTPVTAFSINKNENYIAGNSLIFGMDGTLVNVSYPAEIFIDKVRGATSNDLFASGSLGMVMHFNGIEWQRVDPAQSGRLTGIYHVNNTVFIAGGDNGIAKIYIGRR